MTAKLSRLLCAILSLLLLSSILTPIALASNDNVTVYITDTGEKYHREDCTFLKSRRAVTLSYAVKHGYTRCSRCDPPILGQSKSTDDDPYEKPKSKFWAALWDIVKALLGMAFVSAIGYFCIGLLCIPLWKQIEKRKQRKNGKKYK